MTVVKGMDLEKVYPGTLNEVLWNTVDKHPQIEAVKYRQGNGFGGLTYKQFGERIKKISQGLISLGLKKGDKVSLLSETRYEWALSDFAILTAGGVTVTIYPTLGEKTLQYIVEHSDSKMIILEDREHLDRVSKIWDNLPCLKCIITIDPIIEVREDIYTLNQVAEFGEKFERTNPGYYEETRNSVKPEDISTFVYTSGTTGPPKGTMLSHHNWVFTVNSSAKMVNLRAGEEMMAFLPMAHVYMRLSYFSAVWAGSTMYFIQAKHLAEDLPRVRPKVFPSVPRLFERIYDRIIDQVEQGSPMRRRMFNAAAQKAREMGQLNSRREEPSFGQKMAHRYYDLMVYKKIRKGAGLDRLEYAISGASALSKDLAYFYSGIGVTILEGYGLTETCAPASTNPIELIKPGTIGQPVPGTMIKIADDGEILIKGDHIMQGYYKMPEETKESFTEDGWLKTGDIGEFDGDGYLIFKERKKHLIVLSTGKNVAPLPIEAQLKTSRWVEDAIVVGDDRKYTAALIQPSYNLLLEHAQKHNFSFNPELNEEEVDSNGEKVLIKIDSAILNHPLIDELYNDVVAKANSNFESHEKIKKFILLPEALSVEKGELTPTIKVRRKFVTEKYASLIAAIYDDKEPLEVML